MKTNYHTSRRSTDTTAQQLARFIAEFESGTAKLIRSVRRELRKRLPTATELVYDNYNLFVIGYSASERPSDCIVAIAAAANGVGLAFYHGADVPDPHKILLGSGSQNRFVRLPSVKTLDEPAVSELVRAAIRQAKTPLPRTGGGRTIIRAISAKQRPRRSKQASTAKGKR
jgi:Domain of unknown function (DU1801)